MRRKSKEIDEVLIRAMSDGDMEAFAEIYNAYAPALRRFVAGLVKNMAKAEDIVQNIFLRMASSRPVIADEQALRNWLFVCARNEVISMLRSKWESSVDKVSLYPEVPSDGVSAGEIMPVLDSALEKMPAKRSEVFRLNKVSGLSAEEIAERMGISVRTVQKHLELAGKDIRKYLN